MDRGLVDGPWSRGEGVKGWRGEGNREGSTGAPCGHDEQVGRLPLRAPDFLERPYAAHEMNLRGLRVARF